MANKEIDDRIIDINNRVQTDPMSVTNEDRTFLRDNADYIREQESEGANFFEEKPQEEETPETPTEETPVEEPDKPTEESSEETPTEEKPEEKPEEEEINPEEYEVPVRKELEDFGFGDKPKEEEKPTEETPPEETPAVENAEYQKKLQDLKEREVKVEIDRYVIDNPAMEKYKLILKKYRENKAYDNVPIEVIATYISAKDLKKQGADEARAADKEAAETKTPNAKPRPTEIKDKTDDPHAYDGMSNEQFEAELSKVKLSR